MAARQFFVIANARSGSSQLVSYINQLDDIRCMGEVFKDKVATVDGWQKIADRLGNAKQAKELHEGDLTKFWDMLCATYDAEVKWVGAKIFYRHRVNDPIWDQIFAPTSTVIHLWRPKVIDSFLSGAVDRATGEWTARAKDSTAERTLPKIEFERKRYLAYRADIQNAFRQTREKLKSHAHTIEVEYQEISDPAALSTRLCAFFETTGTSKQTLQKQVKKGPEDFISNYDKLRPYLDDRLDQDFAT